jgi:hypothetical protein
MEWNLRSAVGATMVVDGRLWGVIIASWGDERSPPDDRAAARIASRSGWA